MSKLEELRARKATREAARQAELEVFETQALELEEKWEERGGKAGVTFAVVTTAVGNFVVQKPEFLVGKKFSDAEKRTVEDVIAFVDPCVVHPEKLEARAAFQEHGGIAWTLANECMKLYQADVGAKRGK